MKIYVNIEPIPGVDVDCSMTFACDQFSITFPARVWCHVPKAYRKFVAAQAGKMRSVVSVKYSFVERIFGI